MTLYTLKIMGQNKFVLTLEDEVDCKEPGMLVYRTLEGAEKGAVNQRARFNIDCYPVDVFEMKRMLEDDFNEFMKSPEAMQIAEIWKVVKDLSPNGSKPKRKKRKKNKSKE